MKCCTSEKLVVFSMYRIIQFWFCYWLFKIDHYSFSKLRYYYTNWLKLSRCSLSKALTLVQISCIQHFFIHIILNQQLTYATTIRVKNNPDQEYWKTLSRVMSWVKRRGWRYLPHCHCRLLVRIYYFWFLMPMSRHTAPVRTTRSYP